MFEVCLVVGIGAAVCIWLLVDSASGVKKVVAPEQFEEEWEAYNRRYPNSFDSDEG